MVRAYNTEKMNMWQVRSNLILLMVEDHDKEFRKHHQCTCKNHIEYPDGKWYCEAMQKSRIKNKKIKTAVKEALISSPFLPESSEPINKLLEINGLVDVGF